MGTPIQDKDAATKKYVDDKPRGITKVMADSLYLGKGGGELKGALHFLNVSKITNLGNPQAPTDGANKHYVDSKLGQSGMTRHTADNRYLSLNGGGLKGNLNMRNNKVTSLADPVDPNDATNRSWVETHTLGNNLALDGGTMRGKVDMGDYRIINLPKAIENEDAASVAWVKENTVMSSWVDTRIDEKTPKGIYKLIAYVNGSPDSHVVEYKSDDVLSVTYRKVGTDKQLVLSFKNDLTDGYYLFDFDIRKTGSDGIGVEVYLYGEAGLGGTNASTLYRFWGANKNSSRRDYS